MPLMSGMSIGEGMNSMTASSSACTPLFLKAVPHMHSTTSFLIERWRKPWRISSSESSSCSRYLCMSVSLPSAADSIIFWRYSRASALRFSGISRYSNFIPWVSMSQ